MKFWLGLATAGLIAFSSAAARADDIDLSTLTCSKFQHSDDETIKLILTWLDGYYKDQDDPPVIETDSVRRQCQEARRILLGASGPGSDHGRRQGVFVRRQVIRPPTSRLFAETFDLALSTVSAVLSVCILTVVE